MSASPAWTDAGDPAEQRRRRATERTGIVIRAFGFVAAAMIGFTQPPGAPVLLNPRREFVVAALVALVAANGCALGALRWGRDDRRYRRCGIVQVVLDTVAMVALTAFMSALPQAATWPLMLMPILVAAVRLQLLGTMLTWAGVSVSYALLFAFTSRLYGHPMPLDNLLAGIGLGLVIALLDGMRSRAAARYLAELHAARAELRHQSRHDPLTGLGNRTLLQEHAGRTADGEAPRPVAVLNLDLDGFKNLNDTMGHAAGDELLRIAAQRLRGCVKASDVVIRLGGDEFVILLDDAGLDEAHAVAARVRAALTAPADIGGTAVPIGASIGVAVGGPLDEVLHRADAAMYADKAARRPRR
ncbi:GGDEF domain-containing protein [Dactylosporangium sp. CS-047395]|uniref:GGDEF domain-containing protein n=1 Tax=Dactylosporangium sp. CS-047395 TaxID=3239936 RepID=UPI003D8F274D